ncbi:hypothetical protein [Halalkalibacterium halodurans]|uniref:hypothetical protein n=1 Tax=Halalkalibacterium halodurans TaxID=86665 RepID=UPI002AA98ABD|nr:hypothetical protein [Halalkalibacterium halodurans]MDY7220864.1 hypothetical protein [Halalkalibacterium halodurans]MDY7240103.1 hypothetical protein [Halalkalibacterium halodurans]
MKQPMSQWLDREDADKNGRVNPHVLAPKKRLNRATKCGKVEYNQFGGRVVESSSNEREGFRLTPSICHANLHGSTLISQFAYEYHQLLK